MVLGSLGASPASACGGGAAGHCLVLALGSTSSGVHGITGGTCETKLWIYQPQYDHVNRSAWLYFADQGINSAYWTEVGMANGLYSSNDFAYPVFYWADSNAQYGYNEHFASYGPTAGQVYGWQIKLRSSPWWDVSIAGYTYGYGSWHSATEPPSFSAGAEWTNDNSGATSESGATHTLNYVDNNDNQIEGWPGENEYINASLGTGFWYQHYWWWADRTWDQPWTC